MEKEGRKQKYEKERAAELTEFSSLTLQVKEIRGTGKIASKLHDLTSTPGTQMGGEN